MVKLQILMTLLTFLMLSSIATATAGGLATLGRRGLTTYCDPVFGGCTEYQWPFSPITSNHHFISRPFLRHQSPPLLFGTPSSVVVPSPPPIFTNPSFTPDYANPSFSPLVSSPPPPGNTIPPVFPVLPPAGGDINAFSYTPPAGANLPPIAGKYPPGVFMTPPKQRWPTPSTNLPPIVGELPQQQQPQEVVIPTPVSRNARMKPQLPPVVQSPPAA